MAKLLAHLKSPSLYISAGAISLSLFIGDMIEQKAEHLVIESREFDWDRSKAMSLSGVYYGSTGYFLYSLLNSKYPLSNRTVASSRLRSEMLLSPAVASGAFGVVGLLEDRSPAGIWENIKHNLLLICVVDGFLIAFRPAAGVFFGKWIGVYNMTSSLLYNVFLSFVMHRIDRRSEKLFDESEANSNESEVLSGTS